MPYTPVGALPARYAMHQDRHPCLPPSNIPSSSFDSTFSESLLQRGCPCSLPTSSFYGRYHALTFITQISMPPNHDSQVTLLPDTLATSTPFQKPLLVHRSTEHKTTCLQIEQFNLRNRDEMSSICPSPFQLAYRSFSPSHPRQPRAYESLLFGDIPCTGM